MQLERGDELSAGPAGIALLHIERARTGSGPWSTVQEWAAAMTRDPVVADPDTCGLYRGVPAVAFALHTADQPVYADVLAVLDGHVATITWRRLIQAHERIDSGRLPELREFDLVSGLTGIGVYLLHRYGGDDQLRGVLSYLVRLTEPLTVDGEALPGWWCGTAAGGELPQRWPGGHGNLGLAHGIAGPLALLATAMRRGTTVTGQAEAIDRICGWLEQWHCGAGADPWWPGMISQSERRTGTVRQSGPQRPSWCYGTPGLARAQQLAALALDDPQRQRRAEEALARCVAGEQLSLLGDASVCHGWAGLVLSTWRAAADAGDGGKLADLLPRLQAGMEYHLRRHGPPARGGLLEGEAGVLLTQHTTAANAPPSSGWDACLLLNG
ncbi:lanthionine synthetase C family protein [Streptosporangium sp. NPDC002524]|uniref:lanthionine synthetase C family protein n=1 Tax=Streptosporangium sp. NPDC002524 TaxID=3154537 RepID=UPI00331A91C4